MRGNGRRFPLGKLPGGLQGCRFFCAAALGIILLFPMEIQAAEPGSFTYKSVEEQTEEPDTSLLNDLDFSDIQQTVDEILMDLYKHSPDILCLSCYLWNISYIKQIVTELPKVLPYTDIWLGGPEVSYSAQELLEEYAAVAGIMCGEGEETFLELMEYYHSGTGKTGGAGYITVEHLRQE